jgi:hypothetical protein
MKKLNISIIMESESEKAEYSLLEINVKGRVKYAIYIRAGGEEDFTLFDISREDCERLFEKAVAQQLSPIHLEDVARDHNREAYELNLENF